MRLRRGQHLTRRGRRRLEYVSHGDARNPRGEDREDLETATKKSCRKSRRREGFTVIAEGGERSRLRAGEPAKGEGIEGAVGWNDRRPGGGRGGKRRVGCGALGGISSIWRGDWSSTRCCDLLGGVILYCSATVLSAGSYHRFLRVCRCAVWFCFREMDRVRVFYFLLACTSRSLIGSGGGEGGGVAQRESGPMGDYLWSRWRPSSCLSNLVQYPVSICRV